MAKLKMQVEYRICGNWICIQYLKLWKTIKLITKSEMWKTYPKYRYKHINSNQWVDFPGVIEIIACIIHDFPFFYPQIIHITLITL